VRQVRQTRGEETSEMADEWEYKSIELSDKRWLEQIRRREEVDVRVTYEQAGEDLQSRLNKEEREGWELIEIIGGVSTCRNRSVGYEHRIRFKRRKQQG
jgi:hypothetical protein